MDMWIYLFEIYTRLLSKQHKRKAGKKKIQLATSLTNQVFLPSIGNEVIVFKNRLNKQLRPRSEEKCNKRKNSQSSGHIVNKLLSVVKEERRNLHYKVRGALILQFVQLAELIIHISLNTER